MLKTIRSRMLLALMLASALATTASANMVLDLDTKEGDQGIKTKQVKAGDTIEIELIAQQGAQGIAGFEAVIKFDSQKFTYKDYQKGGLMASAFPLPASKSADGVRISVGILGGQSTQDSGSLGKLIFEATANVGSGGTIALTEGSFGAAGKTDKFTLSSAVTLQGPSATTSSSTKTSTTGSNNPQGQGMNPQGQGMNPQGQGMNPQGQGMNPQGQGTNPRGQGMPSQGQGMNPRGQGMPPQGQGTNPRGQGMPPQGQGMPPQGQGMPPQGQGMNPQGQGMPPQGQGMNPQGQGMPPQGQSMNPQDPATLIKELPTALQSAYIETQKVHLKSELDQLTSLKATLEKTKQYLTNANTQEKATIGKVLLGFSQGMHNNGASQAAPPSNANDLLRMMMQHVDQEIQNVKQKVESLR